MNFVKIPGKDYEFQTTQVTQKDWVDVMGTNPSHFKGDNLPVESFTCSEADEYIRRLNEMNKYYEFRLPTEEEWEHACRAGSSGEYCFDEAKKKLEYYAWYYENSDNRTHIVGLKKPNAFGLYDMHGNVWELTSSIFDIHSSLRVVRGGAFLNYAHNLRSASRTTVWPDKRYYDVGIRLVCTKTKLDTVTILSSEKSDQTKLSDALKEFKKKRPTFGEVQAFKAGWRAKKWS